MKTLQLIFLFVILICAKNITAQKTTQNKEYWDYWNVHIKRIWNETGDGSLHGDEKQYDGEGKLWCYKKYYLGQLTNRTEYSQTGDIMLVYNWNKDGEIDGEQKESIYVNGKLFQKLYALFKNNEAIVIKEYYNPNQPKIIYEKNKICKTYTENGDVRNDLIIINNKISGTFYEDGQFFKFKDNQLLDFNKKLYTDEKGNEIIFLKKSISPKMVQFIKGTYISKDRNSNVKLNVLIYYCKKNELFNVPAIESLTVNDLGGYINLNPNPNNILMDLTFKTYSILDSILTSYTIVTNLPSTNGINLNNLKLLILTTIENNKSKTENLDFLQKYKDGKLMQELKYYPSGSLKSEKNLTTGNLKEFYKSGKLLSLNNKSFFESGKLKSEMDTIKGDYKEYFENGKIKIEARYNKNEQLDGLQKEYLENGELTNLKFYKNNDELKLTDLLDEVKKVTGSYKKTMFVDSKTNESIIKFKPDNNKKILYDKTEVMINNYSKIFESSNNSSEKTKLFSVASQVVQLIINDIGKWSEEKENLLKKSKTTDNFIGFILYYDSINNQSLKINSSINLITNKYEAYSPIIKNEISLLKDLISNYNDLWYNKDKLEKGKIIILKINTLENNYNLLVTQDKEIQPKYSDFIAKFDNNKANKNLYKQGKKLYDNSFSNYEKEGNSSKKIEEGKEVVKILDKLLSLATSDNTELNTKIKSAKTDEEIKSILGL